MYYSINLLVLGSHPYILRNSIPLRESSVLVPINWFQYSLDRDGTIQLSVPSKPYPEDLLSYVYYYQFLWQCVKDILLSIKSNCLELSVVAHKLD